MNEKVAVYCRVSTDREEQQTSFEAQIKYFEQYCKDNHYILVKTYADEGISGTAVKNRTQLLEMLKVCGLELEDNGLHFKFTKCNAPFNLILVKNTSRLGRNLSQVIEIVQLLRQNKVYIHFVDNNIRTDDTSSDFMLNLLQLFDAQYSNDLSNKVKNGYLAQAKTTNKIHSTGRLYGYDYVDRKLVKNKEAKVVKLIFDLYCKGYGIRRIQNELNNRNITTRDGKLFGKTTIINILTNEKYYGLNNRLKYQSSGVFSTTKTPTLRPNAEQYYKQTNDIEPIISYEQFNKVQNILQSKRGNRVGINRGNTPYASKIICGKCESHYTSNVDRGRRFYNCTTKRRRGIDVCNNKNISEKKLDSIFNSEWLINTLHSIKLMRSIYITRHIKQLEQSKDQSNIDEVNRLNILLDKNTIQQNKLLSVYLDGDIDENMYKTKLNELKKVNTQLKQQIHDLSRTNDEIDRLIDSKRRLIEYIKELEVKYEYNKEEIIQYIDHLIINDNAIKVYLQIQGEEIEVPEVIEW